MKKKNPFVRTKQYRYSDHEIDENGEVKSYMNFDYWVDEEDLDQFKSMWEDEIKEGIVQLLGEREINGKEYNEWIIGSVYGDYEGVFKDEECPSCAFLLVDPEATDHSEGDNSGIRVKPDGTERFCSNPECEYVSESFKKYHEADEAYWKYLKDKPEAPKFREPGQTLKEFADKYFPTKDRRGGIPETQDCTVCKRTIPVKDYYVQGGYAMVTYTHEDCTNGGPAILSPIGDKAKQWEKLLGGFDLP